MRPEHNRKVARGTLGDGAVSLGSLLQHALDVVAILDADGTLRYASPAVETMLGYAPEEVPGTAVFDYVHPDDLQRALGAFAETLATPGALPPLEFRARRADGVWRHVEVVRNNRLDDPGVGGVVITVRDVTERKEAEESLIETEVRYRTLVERGPAMTYVHVQKPGEFSGTTYVSPQVYSSWVTPRRSTPPTRSSGRRYCTPTTGSGSWPSTSGRARPASRSTWTSA